MAAMSVAALCRLALRFFLKICCGVCPTQKKLCFDKHCITRVLLKAFGTNRVMFSHVIDFSSSTASVRDEKRVYTPFVPATVFFCIRILPIFLVPFRPLFIRTSLSFYRGPQAITDNGCVRLFCSSPRMHECAKQQAKTLSVLRG